MLTKIVEANKVVKLPRRYGKFGVGKSIGGKIYLHKDYESVLPQEELENAKSYLGDFDYNLLAYAPKTGDFTFTQSPDFDSAPEPSVGSQVLVKPDGTTRAMKGQANPWIYHHKWLWVDDGYTGFDVEESKQRSMDWMSLPDIDYSRIGKKGFWEQNVVPQLG